MLPRTSTDARLATGAAGLLSVIIPAHNEAEALDVTGRILGSSPAVLGIDLVGGHLNYSDQTPGSRRRNENGKAERFGYRIRRRNDSSVYTICRACRHNMCS
jgi:hypothetical protein